MHDAVLSAADRHDLHDASAVTDLFEDAAEAYRADPRRTGARIDLDADAADTVIVAGDLHDHRVNLRRLAKLAKLGDADARTVLVLQELIHGPSRVNNCDLSVRTLALAAALKLDEPTRVYQLLSNHELSQALGQDIMKGGMSTCACFDDGLAFLYGDDAETVAEAARAYVLSLPLAVRVAGPAEGPGVMCAHSLPSPRRVEAFDPAKLATEPDELAVMRGGWAYDMVWGRHHDDATCDRLAEAWGVSSFVLGHQPADMGVERLANRALIVNSDHEHARAVRIKLGKPFDLDKAEIMAAALNAVTLDDPSNA
ncbi:MAG: hypothetical protein AAGB29_03215 [Planctomycetota bacterium]